MKIKVFYFFLPLAVFFAFLAAQCCVSAPSADSGIYLLESHDPTFLKHIANDTDTVYNKGRSRLVRLKLPRNKFPAVVRSKLRRISAGDIHNAPAETFVSEIAKPEIRKLVSGVSGKQIQAYAAFLTDAGKRSTSQLDLKNNSGNRIAMDIVADVFQKLGWVVERHCYRNRKFDRECNVIGRKPAAVPGAKIILVVAHM